MNGHPTSVGQWARREAVGKARIFLKETVAVYFGTQDERVIFTLASQSTDAYVGRSLWQNPEASVVLKKACLKIAAFSW